MAPLAVLWGHFTGKCACSVSGISVFVWIGENDSKTLRVDVNLFINGEKKFVFKRKRIRVEGAYANLRVEPQFVMFVNKS